MFSKRLKQLKKEKGLTQVEFAKAIGVSGGTVAMWETGKRRPGFEILNLLTDFFDRSLDYILGLSGDSDDSSEINSTESQTDLLEQWIVQEEYEDVIRKYSCLTDMDRKRLMD